MSLAHALLTSLLEQPSSGYDLTRRFDDTIGAFWNARHQQIYRELACMEARGWVEASPAASRRKKEYRVRPAGRDELARWMAQPSPPVPHRHAFAVKLRASNVVGGVDLRPEMRQSIADQEALLQRLRAHEARHYPDGQPLSREAAINHRILRRGILVEQMRMEWCREVLEFLDATAADGDAA